MGTENTAEQRVRSGRQIGLRHGPYTATVATVGAVVRELTYAGHNLVVPFAPDHVRDNYDHSVLVPWPNRIGQGRYTFQGQEHQLPLNEVELGNAIHGLVLWNEWDVETWTESRAQLSTRVTARPGYPFDLHVRASYTLDESGLTWRVETSNVGTGDAPYGVGTHPYLTPGQGMADDWSITVPAASVLETSPQTMLPVALHDVTEFEDARYDLRSRTPLARRVLDHAFTALETPDAAASGAEVELRGENGAGVGVSWDPDLLPWVQVVTSDFPGTPADRRAVAVEGMTCPANAFNTGEGLVTLHPGDTHRAWWNIHGLEPEKP